MFRYMRRLLLMPLQRMPSVSQRVAADATGARRESRKIECCFLFAPETLARLMFARRDADAIIDAFQMPVMAHAREKRCSEVRRGAFMLAVVMRYDAPRLSPRISPCYQSIHHHWLCHTTQGRIPPSDITTSSRALMLRSQPCLVDAAQRPRRQMPSNITSSSSRLPRYGVAPRDARRVCSTEHQTYHIAVDITNNSLQCAGVARRQRARVEQPCA